MWRVNISAFRSRTGGAVEEEPEPKKKRSNGWTQEQRDAQAERMRQRQAEKKAAREAEHVGGYDGEPDV